MTYKVCSQGCLCLDTLNVITLWERPWALKWRMLRAPGNAGHIVVILGIDVTLIPRHMIRDIGRWSSVCSVVVTFCLRVHGNSPFVTPDPEILLIIIPQAVKASSFEFRSTK